MSEEQDIKKLEEIAEELERQGKRLDTNSWYAVAAQYRLAAEIAKARVGLTKGILSVLDIEPEGPFEKLYGD